MRRLAPLALALALVSFARAEPPGDASSALDDRVGARVPLDLAFTTPERVAVRLRDYVRGDRPVLLVLAYARCEMLCSRLLRAVADAVARSRPLVPGRDYRIVTVSIDPQETPEEAARNRTTLLERIGYAEQGFRWTYLVDGSDHAKRLADALGFRYAQDPLTRQYAHPSVAFVLTPDGRVARVLEGFVIAPDELAAAIDSASRGELAASSAWNDVLRCFRYAPGARRRGAALDLYFRAGGLVLLAAVAGLVLGLVRSERSKRA